MSYLKENLGTIIVSLILLLIVVLIIRSLIIRKKKGVTSLSCGCDCANCTLNCKKRI